MTAHAVAEKGKQIHLFAANTPNNSRAVPLSGSLSNPMTVDSTRHPNIDEEEKFPDYVKYERKNKIGDFDKIERYLVNPRKAYTIKRCIHFAKGCAQQEIRTPRLLCGYVRPIDPRENWVISPWRDRAN